MTETDVDRDLVEHAEAVDDREGRTVAELHLDGDVVPHPEAVAEALRQADIVLLPVAHFEAVAQDEALADTVELEVPLTEMELDAEPHRDAVVQPETDPVAENDTKGIALPSIARNATATSWSGGGRSAMAAARGAAVVGKLE